LTFQNNANLIGDDGNAFNFYHTFCSALLC
jgi:hypothetical protein